MMRNSWLQCLDPGYFTVGLYLLFCSEKTCHSASLSTTDTSFLHQEKVHIFVNIQSQIDHTLQLYMLDIKMKIM